MVATRKPMVPSSTQSDDRITVSVVIPTYNRAYIIHGALESALRQTYREFEIIVVDDGSSDNTEAIVGSLTSDKIRYIRHDRNRGCSAGYNTGIAEAKGSVIAMLDSDDEWKPDYLEKQLCFLRDHPDVDVVFCDTEIVEPSQASFHLMSTMSTFSQLLQKNAGAASHVISGRNMYLCLLEEVPIKPTAAIIRREMFDRVGLFSEAAPSGTDWDLFLRLSRAANFGYVDQVLAIQKRTPDATHQKFLRDDKLFLIDVFLREKASLVGDEDALRRVNRGMSSFYNSLAWSYLQAGRYRETLSTYYRGFKETLRPRLLRKLASAAFRIGLETITQARAKARHELEGSSQKEIDPPAQGAGHSTKLPKVSIVIAAYNRGYIIREALDSALSQTYEEYEILVVDDGSSDNTQEIVNGIHSDKIRYIRHAHNRGYSAACNSGIAAATGELIGFLDSDDVWYPSKLEQQVALLSSHPEVDAVFSDVELAGTDGAGSSLMRFMKCFPRLLEQKGKAKEYVFSGREMYLCLLEEIPIKPTVLIAKRELFKRVGPFDESWPSGTDWDMFLRFSRLGACFGYVDRPLALQRRTPDATHLKFREKDKLFLLSVFLHEREKAKNDRDALTCVNRGISGVYNDLAWIYFETRQRRKSIGAYLKGFQETLDGRMLLRAAFVLVPLRARYALRAVLKRSSGPTPNPSGAERPWEGQ